MARIRRRTAVGFELELPTPGPFVFPKSMRKVTLSLPSGAFSPSGCDQEHSARTYQDPREIVSLLGGFEALSECFPHLLELAKDVALFSLRRPSGAVRRRLGNCIDPGGEVARIIG